MTGFSDGHKEYGDEERPNLEALKEKRDEYLIKAVNEVVKNYDQSQIDLIAKSTPEADGVMAQLVSDIQDKLLKEHRVDLEDISPAGPMGAHEKVVVDKLDEIEATYSREDIAAMVRAHLETGYF